MKPGKILITFVLAVVLLSCGKRQPRHIVILPDVSGSIDRKSLGQAFRSIDELVSHLSRGDKVAIIPILGDAQAQASGRIFRLEIPTDRQAYDFDLRDFRRTLRNSLEMLESDAITHPGDRTDILGSVALAHQELQMDGRQSAKSLAILSDLIEEDAELDFKIGKDLDHQQRAAKFAAVIADSHKLDFRDVRIFLGLLRGPEYARLGRHRRLAIQAFWISYFKVCGGKPTFAADGPGLLKDITQ